MIGLLWLVACGSEVADGLKAFDGGQLGDAIAIWETPGRWRSGVLDYDAGIARYRSADFPRAVARFRGAARLRPRDGNVQHNLALARSHLGAKVPVPVSEPSWRSVLTPGELGLLGVLVTAFGSLLVLPRRTRVGGVLTLLTGVAAGVAGSVGAADQRDHPIAVVVVPDVVLRDAASINAGVRLRLPEGTEVRVEDTLGEFVLVVDGRERRGWVPSNGIERAW